ncbi:MAG TPA: hypothetical protein VIE65_08560 [Methylobacter sp.]|jgi:hypothetical protein
MPVDITTSLTAALQRATDGIIDDIAKKGLVALRKTVEDAGFSHSQYLRNYEIFAHIIGGLILFEIVLDVEAVVADDAVTQSAMNDVSDAAADLAAESDKTFTISRASLQIRRMKDVRRPVRNARKPARDARKDAQDRLVEHELARLAPRSARVTRSGKLAVALKRAIRETKTTVEFPQDKFQGILDDFMGRLKKVVFDTFVPELNEIIDDYAIT